MIKLLYQLLFTWIFFKKNIFFDNSEPMLIVVWKYFVHCCRANNQSINHQSAGTRIEEREKHNHFANQPRSNYNCGGNMILSAKLDFTLRFWASASFINWTQTCGRQNYFFFQLFFFSLSVGVFYPFFCKQPCRIGTDSINRSISFFEWFFSVAMLKTNEVIYKVDWGFSL